MYWKLSGNKMTEVWDFLFQPGPPAQTDLEYNRQRNLVFGVLNDYHDAPRESVSNFLKRMEHIFFLMVEPLTLENYKAQFDEENPFDAEDMEELSDSETFDFESMPLPRVVAQVDDEGEGVSWRYSASPAGLKRVFERETVEDQSSDDEEEERDYEYEPGDKLPKDHETWENDRLFFCGKHHRFTMEDVWGHNVVWHPRKFQPVVKNGKWVIAIKEADGKWTGLNRLGARPFKKKARSSTSCTTTKCCNFERLSTHSKRHRLVELTSACRNLLRVVSIREAVEEETEETTEVTEETTQDLMEEVTEETAQDLLEEVREETAHDLLERGQAERGRAERGRVERGRAERGRAGRGWAERGRAESIERSGVASLGKLIDTAGSRDSDMRDEAALKSYQVRVDSHLSARILFPDVEESLSHRTQPTSPVHNTLLLHLLEEGERLQHTAVSPEPQNHSLAGSASSFCLEAGMPSLQRRESATVSSLSSDERLKLRIDSELLTSLCGPSASSARRKVRIDSELLMSPCKASASSAPTATVPRGEENARSSTSCTTTKCCNFERLSTHPKRHLLVELTSACRNLRWVVSIREAVEEETKETAEVTEETTQDLMEEVTEETAQDLLEEVREETAHDLLERGQAERGRAERGRVERGRAERGRAGRGQAERGRAESVERSGVASLGKLIDTAKSRDSDMRDEASLKSYQVRVDSHLSARILFPDVEESLSHRTQPTSPVDNSLLLHLLEEGECLQHTAVSPERQNHSLAGSASSFCLNAGMPALQRRESATVSSLSSDERRKLRIDSELLTTLCGPFASSARRKVRIDSELLMSPCRASGSSAPHATVPRGQENVRSNPSHLQLGTVFPCSPSFSYVETQDWQCRKVLEGPAAGVLETGGSEYELPGEEELSPGAHAVQREEETQHWQFRRVLETRASKYGHPASEVASVDSESKSTTAPGEEEPSQEAHDALQREEETQHWPACEVLKGLDAGVLETGASEHERVLETGASDHERQASEGASVDSESKSTAAPGEEELSQEVHALQREEETQHWPAREVMKGLDAGVLVTGTSKEVLYSRSVVATTQEDDVKGGQWTFVEGNDRGEEGRTWTFVEARLLGDEEGEEEPVVEARVHGDEKSEEPVVEGGEVAIGIQMDPEQKDHDSPSTRCGEEQGDRASVLSTGREMVLHG
ncbi:hypothetical protein CBR_g52270 [Chara braunii]|uniref:Uncharacterized protein n=1 Tax=Chara braunii TaxID=69332 RepID=A0A388MA67_CHABU|nr:hypothetical protein CBR_g52270 [Chara braunii]|eukprot:GBG91383.1 hypothetical protein CBR_g52270 [Chara braunii]